MDTPPWWAIPVVAGAFALGGALITLLFGYFRDRRQDKRRWERDLREVCGRFAASLEQIGYELTPADGETFRVAKNLLYRHQFELSFVAPERVVEAARLAFESAIRATNDRSLGDPGNPADQPVILASRMQYQEAKNDFIQEVRKALGVKKLPKQKNK